MKYSPRSKAITIGGAAAKQAALFYPEVFPVIPFYDEVEEGGSAANSLAKLVPSGLESHWSVIDWMFIVGTPAMGNEVRVKVRERIIATIKDFDRHPKFAPLVDSLDPDAWTAVALETLGHALNRDEYDLVYPNILPAGIGLEEPTALDDVDPSFVLSNLDLIDAGSIFWEQIFEIREDPQSIEKLRRLRKWIYKEFDSKPLAFIEDSLAEAMDDYREAALKHGCSLRKSVMKTIFSEKILGTGFVALASAIAGGAPPTISAAIGASMSLGKALIEIRANRREHLAKQIATPIRYLIEIEDLRR